MTTATPIPAAAGYPPMDPNTQANPADPPPDSLPPGLASPPTVTARPTLRGQIAENPLASFLGAMVVALLVSMLATTNIRINRLEDRVDAGFAAQDAKFDKIDAKFDELEAKFDEMNLKLTALIAKLNATDDVDAALEGRLIDRDDNPAAPP